MMALIKIVWYFVVILPYLIFLEGWAMFKKYMSKGKRWQYFPYVVLSILILLLLFFLALGYRW